MTAKAWSNYWAKGFLSTFVDADRKNYTGEVKEYWFSVFANLSKGSSVCDLGAGNGAILALAKEYMLENDTYFELHAVDYSDISSSKFYREHPDVIVHANTTLEEEIDIDAQSIDLCVSQFGFEYSDTVDAVKQVQRILKKGGNFKALMHHVDSEITLAASSAIKQITLCGRSGLDEVTVKLVRRLHKLSKSHRSPAEDQKAEELRSYFNKMATRLNSYADELPDAHHVTYFLNELGNVISDKSKTTNDKILVVEKLKADTENYRHRMESMLVASSDSAKIEAYVKELSRQGLVLGDPKEFLLNDKKFAWRLEATKT